MFTTGDWSLPVSDFYYRYWLTEHFVLSVVTISAYSRDGWDYQDVSRPLSSKTGVTLREMTHAKRRHVLHPIRIIVSNVDVAVRGLIQYVTRVNVRHTFYRSPCSQNGKWCCMAGCLGGAVVKRRTRDWIKVAGLTPGRGAIKSTRSTQPSIPSG